MKEELLKLAERVEALSGPDWEVDSEIDRLTFRGPFEDRLCGCMGNCLPGHPAYDGACVSVPHYTASLDAAMTLAVRQDSNEPDFDLSRDHGGWAASVSLYELWTPDGQAIAATPALALCAAALRALAKEE